MLSLDQPVDDHMSEPHILPFGDRAVLIECESAQQRRNLYHVAQKSLARGVTPLEVSDVVPGDRTVLILARNPEGLSAAREWAERLALSHRGHMAPEETSSSIEVQYLPASFDGPDLSYVADKLEKSPEAFISWFTSLTWDVDFLGFMPGFAYLKTAGHHTSIPRRDTPRRHVRPGSLGLAETYAAIYPRSSPGGWQIVGTAKLPTQPSPGERYQFRPSRESVVVHPNHVVHMGPARLVSAADLAFDRRSHALANRLIGSAIDAPALEITLAEHSATLARDETIAVTGAPCDVMVDGQPVPWGEPVRCAASSTLTIGRPLWGARTYLARTTKPNVGSVPDGNVPAGTSDGVTLRMRPGPRADWCTSESISDLAYTPLTVGVDSDRVGVRLLGADLQLTRSGHLPSEPVTRGAVQVTPSGELVVFGPDHPLTGGYPVVAVIFDDDLDELGQLRPGQRVWLAPG